MMNEQRESQFYIPARTSLDPEGATRLKHGDTFGVFDRAGDILGFKGNTDGIYHRDTRHLSHCELRINGARPIVLTSAMQTDNSGFVADLTNPDFYAGGEITLAKDNIHLQRLKFAWNNAVYERITIQNYDRKAHPLRLSFTFGADYADLFEARGQVRSRRGHMQAARVENASVTLRYDGLDDVARETRLSFHPRPDHLDEMSAAYTVEVAPGGECKILLCVDCAPQHRTGIFDDAAFLAAMIGARRSLTQALKRAPRIASSETVFDDILSRAHADLAMLTTETPEGPYPYAGIPWFSTPFGRDALITALFTLWYDPQIARGVLRFLARRQATGVDAFQDAEPGKILHELRYCEMAATREVPFGTYYGSVDSTPLFIMLAGAYFDRTHDMDTLRDLWPAIEKALGWMMEFGDADGDGFIEYARQRDTGLANQGWKDSHDSISHADGRLADGPIALVEVQAYAYGAWLAAARIGAALNAPSAAACAARARRLKDRFEEAFWLEDLGVYALALDGDKQPLRVVSSNAGHALTTGIADPERAARMASRLLQPDMFSGWGIRTLSADAARYNPMSYHNGSVWPHDNAMIALGLARYGQVEAVMKIFEALTAAAGFLPLDRLPELFCGFERARRTGPTGYPVACAPQAWAAAAPIALVAAGIGLDFEDGRARLVGQARLPDFLDHLSIDGIRDRAGTFSVLVDQNGARIARDAA